MDLLLVPTNQIPSSFLLLVRKLKGLSAGMKSIHKTRVHHFLHSPKYTLLMKSSGILDVPTSDMSAELLFHFMVLSSQRSAEHVHLRSDGVVAAVLQ
ncbi:hypothetical protein GDO78_007824 [Eleutherodactylus coqui]|uniref:Uncharacterized protein n=1 Tax=Eleutherodactylus coqui TaxID=57060 RepID=A0A8J6FIA8_ELECQ|nr:hypothetical protein GDO78_007824 [Eleutherodactylus coqui]